jgi:hypothetical protein
MSSPDQNGGVIYNIVKEAGDNAKDQKDHIRIIKKLIEDVEGEKVLAIFPVVKYEHSGVSYRLGTAHGFDYSNNGFYIITDKTQKEIGTKRKDFEKVITEELEAYTSWANGEIYCFMLYDDDGELADSCGGFYEIEDIREYLPKEWKKENLIDYIK